MSNVNALLEELTRPSRLLKLMSRVSSLMTSSVMQMNSFGNQVVRTALTCDVVTVELDVKAPVVGSEPIIRDRNSRRNYRLGVSQARQNTVFQSLDRLACFGERLLYTRSSSAVSIHLSRRDESTNGKVPSQDTMN